MNVDFSLNLSFDVDTDSTPDAPHGMVTVWLSDDLNGTVLAEVPLSSAPANPSRASVSQAVQSTMRDMVQHLLTTTNYPQV